MPKTPQRAPIVATTPYTIVARYVTDDMGGWVDMPEARPRARARTPEDAPPALIEIDAQGELRYQEDAGVEIDRYDGDEYAQVRAEGEARWQT